MIVTASRDTQDRPSSHLTATRAQSGASMTRNVSLNWLQMAAAIVYSLAVTPFVIRALGTEGYGVWSFVNGLTTYADFFYLGLGGALIRFVAEFRARDDLPRMRRLCSVVFTVYIAIGGLFLVGAVMVSPAVPRLLGSNLQSISASMASITVILIGARISALFAGSVFSGILFAHDRNDIFKGILIAFTCVRLALVPLCVRGDYSLVILAAIFTVTSWAEALVLSVFARRVTGGLSIRPVIPQFSDLRPLYAFGLMSFGIQVSSKLISYTDTTVIGMKLGATDVALYTLPLQLIEYRQIYDCRDRDGDSAAAGPHAHRGKIQRDGLRVRAGRARLVFPRCVVERQPRVVGQAVSRALGREWICNRSGAVGSSMAGPRELLSSAVYASDPSVLSNDTGPRTADADPFARSRRQSRR